MDASKITELLQKQNTKYINRCKTVDSSTLIWKNQIQSSKYIKGVATCSGEQNTNVPTIASCNNSFGGAGRTTSIQTGSSEQFLSVYAGASGSASRIYSSDSILLQKAGNESCANTSEGYVVLPNCDCTNTNGPNNDTVPVNNQSNPYLPQFDTYYAMKTPCIPVRDANQKHFVKECHTRFPDANNGVNAVFSPPLNVTKLDPITKEFYTTNNPVTCDGCVLEPL
jgi:hypothetical protein